MVGGGGGFAALGAGSRRVVVLMTPFPPFGGGNARLEAVCSPRSWQLGPSTGSANPSMRS